MHMPVLPRPTCKGMMFYLEGHKKKNVYNHNSKFLIVGHFSGVTDGIMVKQITRHKGRWQRGRGNFF